MLTPEHIRAIGECISLLALVNTFIVGQSKQSAIDYYTQGPQAQVGKDRIQSALEGPLGFDPPSDFVQVSNNSFTGKPLLLFTFCSHFI